MENFIQAVRREITAVLNSGAEGAEKVSLHGGRRVGGSGETAEYLFSCKSWKDSFTGKKLLIRLSRTRGPWTTAEVHRIPDGKIRVITEADLGSSPQNAQLREDDSANWVALAERLESVNADNGTMNRTAADWVLGLGRPAVGRCADPDRYVRDYRELKLNDRQRTAIEQALGSEITFVWGPPGTGKTEVVGRVVEGCYRQGSRVLFLAPTHVAVDQALERMCELLAGEPDFPSGLVQRAGEITVTSLADRYGEQLIPERLVARLSVELDTEITETANRLRAVQDGIALHQQIRRLSGELDILRDRWRQADRAMTSANQAAQAAEEHAAHIMARINAIGNPSGMFAGRKAAKLEEARRELWAQTGNASAARESQAHADADRQGYGRRIHAIELQLTALRLRLDGVDSLDRLQHTADALQRSVSDAKERRRRVADSVRSRCRLMGATVSKALQSRRLMDSVDVVVIDEAGMVDLPSAWCAAGLAGKRVIVAGDFRQLPAVTHASGDRNATPQMQEHSRAWMDRDVFHAAGLVGAGGKARHDARLVSLNTQYRMRPGICSVVNEVAYPDAPLITGRDDISGLPDSPLIESSLVLVDTSSRRLPDSSRRTSSHKSSPVHEAVIHELVRGLQYDTVLPARKHASLPNGKSLTDLLAVIAPYRDQVRALKASLKYRFGAEYDGVVDTVHRFQGSQRPLVIIDTVAGTGDKLGFFYEGLGLSSTTCRLLNVALSRAQDHLVVVADLNFLHDKLHPGSEAARLLRHLERHAQRLSVDDLVPFRSAADLAGLDAEELARPAFFPADEVDKAVEWDISQAVKSIDVYCAFLDPNPVRFWLRRLVRRVADGVQVTVHTRDHEPGSPAAGLIGEIQATGCVVSTRERMHEKVLVIDETVLWHGSLNLLARSGPTDLMMRITDPESCTRVRHIMDRARMERPARRPQQWRPATGTNGNGNGNGNISPGDVVDGRLYLDVPIAEKDEAKRLVRARWDPNRKLWHVDAAVIPLESVRRWLPRG